MPRHGRLRSVTERFSRNALFVSASALCLTPAIAEAGPRDNVPFISLYGGYLFNESQDNLEVSPDDQFLEGLGDRRPGEDGIWAGIEVGAPLTTTLDWRASLNATWLGDDDGEAFTVLSDGTSESYASNRLNMQYFDLELGYRPGIVAAANLRLFGGVRGLRIDNDLEYGYHAEFDSEPDKVGQYDHDITLLGAGPRIGLESTVPLGDSGLSFGLMGAGSVLFAKSTQEYSFADDGVGFPPVTEAGSFDDTDYRTVYNLEGRIGVNYAVTDRASLELGYQAQQFWNASTVIQSSNDPFEIDDEEGDLLVHGPYARFTIKLD